MSQSELYLTLMLDVVLKTNVDLSKSSPRPRVACDEWRETTRKMIGGDRVELARYYESFFPLMFQEVKRLSGRDEATCLDIVQDAMIKAIRCMKPMDSESELRAWSNAVVRTTAYDWLRKHGPASGDFASMERETSSESLRGGEPDWVLAQARLRWVEEELQTLPRELQSMISMRYRLGWSLKKIASQFGMKTGAVDGRMRRAIEKLRSKAETTGSVEFENDV